MTALLVILVLALGGGGFWFYKQSQGNPKESAEKWMHAFLAKDYKTTYAMTSWKGDSPIKSADSLAAQMREKKEVPVFGKVSAEDMLGQLNVKVTNVGEPKADGAGMKVPITVKFSLMGQEQSQITELPMRRVNGVWKVESSGDLSNQMMKQAGN